MDELAIGAAGTIGDAPAEGLGGTGEDLGLAGGVLLTDDLMELRVKGSVPRVSALNNVMAEKGVTHMAAICAICKSQFTKVLPYYGMEMDQIVSLHQLVSNAIVLTPGPEDEEPEDEEVEAEGDD